MRRRFRNGLQRALELAVVALMVALALVVVLGVVFRRFGAALVWYDEVASILLAWLTFYGAALAALPRQACRPPPPLTPLTSPRPGHTAAAPPAPSSGRRDCWGFLKWPS